MLVLYYRLIDGFFLQDLKLSMTKYLKIEYLIAPDGKITERVINGSGNDCLETTAAIWKLVNIVA